MSLDVNKYLAMKMYGRVVVSDQLHAPAALLPGKYPQVPIGYKAGIINVMP